MKYDLFFKLAKEAGIEQAEIVLTENYSLSFGLFHSEIDNYETHTSLSVMARGLVNGKIGIATSDIWSKDKAKYLVDSIVRNAKAIEIDDPNFIFEGSPKYKRVNTFNKDLMNIPVDTKIKDALTLEKLVKEGDSRIAEVAELGYQESSSTITLLNSHGLKLTKKNNNYFLYAQAVAKDKDQTKSNVAFTFGNDYSALDLKALAKEVVSGAVDQLGGEPCESGDYKVVLSRDVVSSLLSAYLSSADAEEVQKHSSLFIGKLNSKIASSKLTIEDRPLDKTLFASAFDDEGVATFNKPIIKSGVLKTYLYNLTTAAKDGVQSTGNALRGAKMGVAPAFLVVKPGKLSLDDMFEKVGNGVYVTDVQGLHSGLDEKTGNFSLQSTGFLIKDGKKDRGLDIITVSGNLLKLFQDVTDVGNDSKIFAAGIKSPSLIVKKLKIGGK